MKLYPISICRSSWKLCTCNEGRLSRIHVKPKWKRCAVRTLSNPLIKPQLYQQACLPFKVAGFFFLVEVKWCALYVLEALYFTSPQPDLRHPTAHTPSSFTYLKATDLSTINIQFDRHQYNLRFLKVASLPNSLHAPAVSPVIKQLFCIRIYL